MANDTIFIRNTDARRAQLDWLAERTGRANDTDCVDFALSFTVATLDAAQNSRLVVTGFEQRADSLAALPDVEASALALVDGLAGQVITQQEARERIVTLVRLAGCEARAAWVKGDGDV